jgi:hypothetical protein
MPSVFHESGYYKKNRGKPPGPGLKDQLKQIISCFLLFIFKIKRKNARYDEDKLYKLLS